MCIIAGKIISRIHTRLNTFSYLVLNPLAVVRNGEVVLRCKNLLCNDVFVFVVLPVIINNQALESGWSLTGSGFIYCVNYCVYFLTVIFKDCLIIKLKRKKYKTYIKISYPVDRYSYFNLL